MYELFSGKQIYEKYEVDSAIEGVVSTADTASNNAASALAKANQALAETDRIKDAYNMAEQAFNKMDTYDTTITNTLSAATNAVTLSTQCSTKAQEALEKADVAYNRTPVKYVTALPEQAEDVIYGIKHNDTITTQSNTTFIDIIGTYFMRQSEGKYITRNNYTVRINDAAVGSISVSGENINCYTNKDFTDMLPDTYNTYDSYNFTIIESVDHTDYYVGNSTLNIVVKLATYDTVENKFADKDFVNSAISTNTAYFRGTFESITALESYSGKKTNNDYAFVVGVDAAGNTKYSRYKWDGLSWVFEYDLNNSSFTAEQWAAIQSGITAEILQRLLGATLTPVGTIQAYAGATAPQGYLLCQGQAVSKSEYAELYLVIGDLYSNAETAEGFFNVPDLRDKFAQGANGNLGEVIEAGLPNITGTVGSNQDITPSGAFSEIRRELKNSGAEPYASKAYFNASKGETKTDGTIKTETEHHVYGASDTVQPPAVAINYIIKY